MTKDNLRELIVTKDKLDRRVKCIYCKKPIHIDNFAGVVKKGFICKDITCLMELAEELEDVKIKDI